MPKENRFDSGRRSLSTIDKNSLADDVVQALVERREKKMAFGEFVGVVVRSNSRDKALLLFEAMIPKMLNRYDVVPEIKDMSSNGNVSSEELMAYVRVHPGGCYLVYDPERRLENDRFYVVDLDDCY